MDKLITIDFIFNVGETKLKGQALTPFINGKIFKPIKVNIISGFIDDDFKRLKGSNGQRYRDFKKSIINKYAKKTNLIGIFNVINNFSIDGPFGFVNIASLLCGYSTNMNSNIVISAPGTFLDGLLAGRLFRAPKTYKGDANTLYIDDLKNVIKSEEKYFKKLCDMYQSKYKTCSEVKDE